MLQTFSLPGAGSPQALVLSQLNLHEASSLHSNRRLLKRWHSDEPFTPYQASLMSSVDAAWAAAPKKPSANARMTKYFFMDVSLRLVSTDGLGPPPRGPPTAEDFPRNPADAAAPSGDYGCLMQSHHDKFKDLHTK